MKGAEWRRNGGANGVQEVRLPSCCVAAAGGDGVRCAWIANWGLRGWRFEVEVEDGRGGVSERGVSSGGRIALRGRCCGARVRGADIGH